MPKKAVSSEARRCLLNVRTTEAIRKKLEDAAAASGRPLIHEVEHRLEVAFWVEDFNSLEKEMFSNLDNQDLGTALKLAAALASKFDGKSWRDSALARHMLRQAVNRTLDVAFGTIDEDPDDTSLANEDLAKLDRSVGLIANIAAAHANHRHSADTARRALKSAAASNRTSHSE